MRHLTDFFPLPEEREEFDKIRISIASPDRIRSWSYGEVKKPETINYRTFKPERDGLFCARIFGPIKDYECLCGKYKRIKYKDVVCEKCGVEVTRSKVRRERMGHITLAAPVAHIWFLKALPSRISALLDMTLKSLERVLYFESHIVMDPGLTPLAPLQLLTDTDYEEALDVYGEGSFTVSIGAEALQTLLKGLDLEVEVAQLREALVDCTSELKRKKFIKRLKVFEGFLSSGTRPEWMVLDVLPVIPPELRPLVPLDGGRFATSDLNDLYRRVINRNNRLNRLLELNAPGIITRNEKRMLQEAVDALFDNGRRGRVITGATKRPLKSLSDMLKGKQGRFRQNLLGKRVDYSGRSVIVVGPDLLLHQCGLPKKMALEMFKPFIYAKLEKYGMASTLKAAKRMVESERPEVWDVLEEVIREHPVLLNRAPTLHRLGIQAFEPLLVEGKAIQLHPLVCTAFNADFDGDQMAVHVPLSVEARIEARVLMMSTNNILSPANGLPIIVPSQDIVLGLYYLSCERQECYGPECSLPSKEALAEALSRGYVLLRGKKGLVTLEPDAAFEALSKGEITAHRLPLFSTPAEVEQALEAKAVTLHTPIYGIYEGVKEDGEVCLEKMVTTPGRILLSEVLPRHPRLSFSLVNKVLTQKEISHLIDVVYRYCGQKETVVFCDRLMNLGFHWACLSGISFGKDDLIVPKAKDALIQEAQGKVSAFERQYQEGLITQGEKYNKKIDVWSACGDAVAEEMMKEIAISDKVRMNSVYVMADSGARGSVAQLRQLAGMRGLMAKPSGEIIETPIISNFKEGLSGLEYFNSTHGARKGLADTALKTANSGYLTRRLVDVAQDCIIIEHDCGTTNGLTLESLEEDGVRIQELSDRALGRVLLEDVHYPSTDDILFKAGTMIEEDQADRLKMARVERVRVRSVLTCGVQGEGTCALCYGRDLSRGSLVNQGEAVGVIAAQSIGEPGTQLTMRTFHIGGAAQRRVEKNSLESSGGGVVVFEGDELVTGTDGLSVVVGRHVSLLVKDEEEVVRERYRLAYGARLHIKEGERVEKGHMLAQWDPHTIPIIAEKEGYAHYVDLEEGVSLDEVVDEVTGLSNKIVVDWRQQVRSQGLRPRVTLRDAEGEVLHLSHGAEARYFMSVGAVLSVDDGAKLNAGDIVARIPRESLKTRDITGGLPRVAELFEARRSKNHALMSAVDGHVTFGKDHRLKQRLIVTPEDETVEPVEYLIPKGRHVSVQEGDFVRRGETLMEGDLVPHDILEVLGIEALADYFCQEVQSVYRLQGVSINDKHIEVILRQMLQKVEILEPGGTLFVTGEHVSKEEVVKANEKFSSENREPARFKRVLQGITKASLQTNSFISSASFQETTRVLTEAAVAGQTDILTGLKENVIVGRLVPAGTGATVRRLKREAQRRDALFAQQRRSSAEAQLPPPLPPAEEAEAQLPPSLPPEEEAETLLS